MPSTIGASAPRSTGKDDLMQSVKHTLSIWLVGLALANCGSRLTAAQEAQWIWSPEHPRGQATEAIAFSVKPYSSDRSNRQP